MAGGLRYERFSDMPAGMQKQVAGKILEKYATLPQAQPQELPEKSCRGEECILWWECNGIAIDDECPWR